ncbi:MAG TPA: hypothetical protein VD993_14275 [Chitinophagaceae bacterium]|nr:hypothetical protein [Chitinophagaceae bacterium]
MNDKNQSPEQDRHLQAPGEANRDKHINFLAIESGDPDPSTEDDSKLHLTDDSTLQTHEEKEQDNRVDPRQDRNISVSEDDLRDAGAGRLTGREPRNDEEESRNG